jgi:hypothetical protein
MKRLSQILQDDLLDYLDGKMAATKRDAFEQLIQNDIALQQRLEELRKADATLRLISLEHPSKNFTASVMSKLDQSPLYSGLSIRNGIFLLAGIISVMAIALVLLSAGVFDHTATYDLNNISIVQRYIKQTIPAIPVDGKILVNIIVILNLALAFILLDRTILRPFFQRRMQAGH